MKGFWASYGWWVLASVLVCIVGVAFVVVVGHSAVKLGPGAVGFLVSGCLAALLGGALPFFWRRRYRRFRSVSEH